MGIKPEFITIIEEALGKSLEEMVDFATGKFKCKLCSDKKKFVSEKAIIEAAALKKKLQEENKL